MTAEEYLQRLFETNITDPRFYDINPPYEGDVEAGAKPFWDPLCEVWARRANPYAAGTHRWWCWEDARALLEALHAQYLRARTARTGEP